MNNRLPELRVEHCPSCGKVYQMNHRGLCAVCAAELDQQLQVSLDFMKRNRNAEPLEVSEATGIPLKQITLLITKGWIPLRDYPNLSYPCQSCNDPIRNDKLCVHCKIKLNEDIENMRKIEKEKSGKRQGAYFKDRFVR